MRRSARFGSWRRGVVQLGLLAGVGVALVGGQPGRVGAGPMPCQLEGKCTLKKPRLMFVAEYSTAMNQPFDDQLTRWEAVAEAIEVAIDFDNGYVAENFILGLLRFGSDPEPMVPDTAIDGTGLVDGVALDVAWYDPQEPQKFYRECTVGDEIVATLDDLPPPPVGIGSWARGGLLFTKGYLASSDADHPLDAGKRRGVVVLLSAGVWTDPAGTKKLGPASEHPKLAAGELFTELGVPTYVVNVGGAAGKLVSDPVALAGGTEQVLPGKATELAGVEALANALKGEILKAQNDVVVPVCQPSFPRVMLIVDGSSAMLNVDGVKAGPGLGPWDQVREALAGPAGLLDAALEFSTIEDVHVLGLATFGGAEPAEEAVLVQYAACPGERVAWALDPASSCVAPGCLDPYAAAPIQWTFQDGALLDPPGFDEPTISHMPLCEASAMQPGACTGSQRFTHLGLALVESNLAAYRAACLMPDAPVPCDAQTEFFNVLITDGKYDSTDEQVQARLVAMFADGVITRVVGYGPDVDVAQLELMADWGSGDALDAVTAATQDELEQALVGLFKPPVLDECCSIFPCSSLDGGEGADESGDPGDTGDPGDSSGSSSGAVEVTTTGTTTTGATTTGATSTTDAESGAPTTGTSGATSTTGSTEPTPTSAGPGDPGAGETSEGEGSSGTAVIGDDGCGCTSGGDARGLWLLGLAGLLRRRRRA